MLPKGAQEKKSLIKSRTKSQMKNEMDDNTILLQEQGSTPISGYHSRRDSRMNVPPFPEPVEEARQRFSTPRHAGSKSPISINSTISAGASGSKR